MVPHRAPLDHLLDGGRRTAAVTDPAPRPSPRGPLRIAITHPYSWPEVRRGAERIIVESARALARRGHDVTVLTAGDAAGTTTEAHGAGEVTTVRFRRVLAVGPRHERWFGLRILPALLRGRFDAVHSMMPRDAVAAIRTARRTGHRTVYEELGNPYRWWWEGLPDRRARARVVADVDVFGCMSAYAQSVLAEQWGRTGARIPGGVRLDQFRPVAPREPAPTILFAGAVAERRKGLAPLLAAVALLHDEHPDLRLWVSGDGDIEPLLDEAPPVARSHVVHLPLGAPHDQGDRCARSWCLALPSTGDSFGLVLLESLAAGTPIVVADDAAPPELAQPGVGEVARLDDPASLADALRRAFDLASDPATPERCRGAAAGYDWDEGIAPLLESLYRARGRDEG